jgi:hypothetical protein
MNASEGFDFEDRDRQPRAANTHPRVVGAPLPVGSGGRAAQPRVQTDPARVPPVPPPGRALANSSPQDSQSDLPSGAVQRAANMLRQALPFVQRLLPLLDGHIATAVSNVLTPQPQSRAPQPQVNLMPIEDGLAELQTRHLELRDQVVEQNTSLKRVEDQLEMVREATDRNTLEQQELMEDLRTVGNKLSLVALVAFGLLAISILLNIVLFLHIQRVLP